MKYFIEFLKALIISPELVAALIIIGISIFQPNWVEAVGNKVKSDQEIWKFLPAIPFAILAWAISQSKDILFPSASSSNRLLLDWPYYWKLKIRVIVSMFLILLCVFASLAIWIFKDEASSLVIGSVFGISTMVSCVVACTLWLATINIRQIVEK
jgi:hypothetical protein